MQITARVESTTPLSDEERNKKIKDQIEAQINGPEEKIKAILKPEQQDLYEQFQKEQDEQRKRRQQTEGKK